MRRLASVRRWVLGGAALLCAVALVLAWSGLSTDGAGPAEVPAGSAAAGPTTGNAAARELAAVAPGAVARRGGSAAAREPASAVEVEQRLRRRVHGRVVTLEGRPVLAADVFLVGAPGAAARTGVDGRFELELPEGTRQGSLRSRKAGHRVLLDEELCLEGEAWREVELILGEVGAAVVEARFADGRPLAGLTLDVLAFPDLEIGATEYRNSARLNSVQVLTNEYGIAEFEHWAGVPLAISIDHHGWGWVSRSETNGVLQQGDAGLALRLDPGRHQRWVLDLEHGFLLRGEVLRADGRLSPASPLRVFDGPPETFAFNASLLDASTDAAGRFELFLPNLAYDSELWLLAGDEWWWRYSGKGVTEAKLVHVVPRTHVDGEAHLTIQLEPLPVLRGRVLDAQDEPFSGSIWALPAGAPYILEKTSLGILAVSVLESDGRFEIRGMLPGTYDIIVKRTLPRTYHRFNGYRTGAQGIELRIQEDRDVRIRIVCAGAPEGGAFEPILLTHHFHRPAEWGTPTTPSVVQVRDETPERWIGRTDDTWSEEYEDGRRVIWIGARSQAREHDFGAQQPGWYSVGARRWDAAGEPLPTLFSEPRYLGSGEFEFRIEP